MMNQLYKHKGKTMYNLPSTTRTPDSSFQKNLLLRAFRSMCLAASLALLATGTISHASTPYSGTPIAIPGTIEAENYDLGGEGDAYHDTTPGNSGPATYRTDDVDHEACSEGGYNIGWTAQEEWLKYTVNVASNGSYDIVARVASLVGSGAYHIEVNDVDVTGTISVGPTGGWQNWQNRTSTVTLSAGQQVIKLVIDGAELNINRLDITYNGPPPEAPTGLQVDSTGVNSVSLSWTPPGTGSPTGYNVKRATSSGGPYTIVGSTTAPTVTFTDSVTGGSTYWYVVSALTAGGESADSSSVSATPTLGVPGAPTELTANAGNNQVTLSWTAPAAGSPTSYNVKRSTTSGSGYVEITAPGAQTTTGYTDTTAVNGTTYYYVVSAVNAVGEGGDSAQADATPAAFTGVYEPFDYSLGSLYDGTPATGSGLTGSWTCGTPGSITAGLTYPDLPAANNALSSSGGRQFATLADPLSSGTKWISFLFKTSSGNPGATINGVYFPNGGTGLWFGFGLSAVSETQGNFGLGSMDTTGTAAINGASPLTLLGLGTYGDTYLVVMKIDFDTSGNNDTVTVYLNPVANQDTPGVPAAGTHDGFNVGTLSGVGLNVIATTVTIDEIRTGNTYAEAVAAVSDPPAAPTGLNAVAGINHISLSWTAATGIPSSYNVKRASSAGGPYTTIDSVSIPTVTYEEDILGGQTYYYVVSAVNNLGEGPDSTYVAVTPTLAAPNTPTGLTAAPTNSLVSLSWNSTQFATGYTVKRATDFAGPYYTIGNTTAPDVTFDDTDVTNAITYYYVVAATGAGGSSDETSPISATPFGPMPLVASIEQGVGIAFYASNNIAYQVQWADEDLGTNTVWHNMGEAIRGNGETNTLFDPVGEPHNYYRVISIQ
jgi:fibronectin type 3 domain-containing protein